MTATNLNKGVKRPVPPKADAPIPKRQKRDGNIASGKDNATPTPAAAAAAAASQDFGAHMMTQLTYAVDFLKSKRTPKTLQEILDHLTLQHMSEGQQSSFSQLMKRHSRIQFNPTPRAKSTGSSDLPAWRTGTYEFKAKLPGVTSKVTLLEYLQHKVDASCTSVKDIKDGWPDCDGAIDELEKEHKILTVRTKKDNHAKHVWLDSPELHHEVDAEFQVMWAKIKLPPADEMVRKLKALGQKATSDDPRDRIGNAPKTAPKKKKAPRTQKRFENAHMKQLFEMNPNKRN
ncbi:transcription initiation factor IIE, beta subunit [Durotheca rogersii]|uniref:transcription initiation factor IIE, beta subunit n=1 Tax=Durotheca rogersii TaxID=419775 RepID=UPI002220DB6C|nr:transcription initiation factor IIE, beta subunit [Durotheca rogersii]KAI5865955.1 transcription initiation factor IIE, beta subunit [Durotheca rogersii]